MSDSKQLTAETIKMQTSHPAPQAIAGSLPYDIVLEIFPRLPVKSLVRFSCVAKSWNSLIFSPEFSKTHVQNLKSLRHRILLQTESNHELKHFSINSELDEHMGRIFGTNVPGVTNLPVISFVGSCNGLICIDLGQKGLVLFNPSTRKSKVLPDFGVKTGYDYSRCYGFGYDESSEDYKVVGFFYCGRRLSSSGVLVKIYSLKTGEITRIKSQKGHWDMKRPPIFANGKLHWLVSMAIGLPYHIAYLDLTTEEYGELKTSGLGFSKIMAQSGGSLYVYDSTRDSFIDVWLVEPDYGVGRANCINLIRNERKREYGFDRTDVLGKTNQGIIHPLFVLNKDHREFVFLYGKKIKILNPIKQSVRSARISPENFITGIAYVESLVHP